MTKIIQRHDTAANWASANPVLAQGEMGIEDDTRKFKFGDGATAWAGLPYASSESGGETLNYDDLINKPKINGVELSNNVSSSTINVSDKFTPDNPIYFNTVRTSNYNGLTYGNGTLTNPLTNLSGTGGSGYVGYGCTMAGNVTFDIDGNYFNSSLYLDIPISQGECLFLINPPMFSITNMGYPYIFGNKNSNGYLKPIISFGDAGGGYGQQIGDNCTPSISSTNQYLLVTGNSLSSVTTPALTYNSVFKSSAVIEFVNSSIRNTYYGSSSSYMYTRNITIDTVPTINEINTLRIMLFNNNGVVDLTKIRKSPISALFSNVSECVASYNNSTQVNLEPKDELYMKLKTDGVTTKINETGELEAVPQETPIATTSTVGTVKPDGTTITTTADGTISSIPPANMITTDNIASDPTIQGLTSGKLDIDATLLSTTGKSTISALGFPSNRNTILTLGNSGATYTAPANGWIQVNTWTTTAGLSYLHINNVTSRLGELIVPNQDSGYQYKGYVPCSKGDNVLVYYDNLDLNKTQLLFIYAQGAESEAS